MGDPSRDVTRTSRVSIGFALGSLVLAACPWAIFWYEVHRGTSPQDPRVIEEALLSMASMALAMVLGLLLAGLAFIPRGRAWRLATACAFAHLTLPLYLCVGLLGLAELAVTLVVIVVVESALARWLRRRARERGWSKAGTVVVMALVLPVPALLLFVVGVQVHNALVHLGVGW